MAWDPVKQLNRGTATLWRDRESGTWAVTANRPQSDSARTFLVQPVYGLNHPRTKQAAMDVWASRQAAAAIGRIGGSAKVPKGFSRMDPERREQIAKDAAAKRWGNVPTR